MINRLEQDPEVLATFKGEAYDRLAELECGLDLLRHGQAYDLTTVVHDLFRSAHSLKATASLLGFLAIEKETKRLEEILHELRKMGTKPDEIMLETMLQLLDSVGLHIDDL